LTTLKSIKTIQTIQTPTDETVMQILRQFALKHRDFSIDIFCPYTDGRERFTEIMIYDNQERRIATVLYESETGEVKGMRCSSFKDKTPSNVIDLMLDLLMHQFEQEQRSVPKA